MQVLYNHETSNLPTKTFVLLSRRTGNPVDITGKTVTFVIYGRNETTGLRELIATVPCSITSGSGGAGSFTMTDASVATDGEFDGYIRVCGGAGDNQIFPSRGSIKTMIGAL